MKKITALLMIMLLGLILSSCGQKGSSHETVDVPEGDPLIYLAVEDAVVSSFDITPDWAPQPDPMAPVDRDMLTRWSPKLGLDNEWIYFDFGKEKVVSKIVIKWERAYATEYEILTSKDGDNWNSLVLKKDSKGGVAEHEFPAIKTRYMKIIGIKRNNVEWGFSIWEWEPYGPQSLNPDEEIIDIDQYAIEKEKEATQSAINAAKTPLTPLTLDEFQKGICYTSWMDDEMTTVASDKTLIYLKKIGVNVMSIVIPAYQETMDSKVVFMNDFEGGDTPNDEAIEHAIKVCHELGMKVMLKPHVDCRDGIARIDIVASDVWFDSYQAMILRYAELAERNKVEIFAVGTELEGTTFSRWEAKWRGVIESVRSVYSGYLTYCANWTEYEEVPFWDMMDFIGIDAYFPLSAVNEPTKEELTASYQKIGADIQAWMTEKGLNKNVVFTEIGFPSSDGAGKQPWSQITDVEDQGEQADCLDALFTAMTKYPFFKGTYLWQYLPQDRWN